MEEPELPLVDRYGTSEQKEEPEIPPIKGEGKKVHPSHSSATDKSKGKKGPCATPTQRRPGDHALFPTRRTLPSSPMSPLSQKARSHPLPSRHRVHPTRSTAPPTGTKTKTNEPSIAEPSSSLQFDRDGRNDGPMARLGISAEYFHGARTSPESSLSSLTQRLRAVHATVSDAENSGPEERLGRVQSARPQWNAGLESDSRNEDVEFNGVGADGQDLEPLGVDPNHDMDLEYMKL